MMAIYYLTTNARTNVPTLVQLAIQLLVSVALLGILLVPTLMVITSVIWKLLITRKMFWILTAPINMLFRVVFARNVSIWLKTVFDAILILFLSVLHVQLDIILICLRMCVVHALLDVSPVPMLKHAYHANSTMLRCPSQSVRQINNAFYANLHA